MSLETRLYLAVQDARARIRRYEPPTLAAQTVGYLFDVPADKVEALAVITEEACAAVRRETGE